MLHGLALDVSKEDRPMFTTEELKEATTNQLEASEIFASPKSSTTEKREASEVFAGSESDPIESSAPVSGVELCGEGLPWDYRIHGAGRTKLAKSPHGWKKKRNVDPDFIIQVEAELRAAMAVGSAPLVSGPSVVEQAAPTHLTATPAPATAPATAPAEITNFAALMSACTAKGLTSEQVIAAVNTAGLGSIPLLAARPDLIPAVAHNLGL